MNNEQQIVSGIVIEEESAARDLRNTKARLAQELADSEQLQKISAALIQPGGLKFLYQQILDAAVTMMHSEMASMQMSHPERNELELLAYKGFHPDSAAFWKWLLDFILGTHPITTKGTTQVEGGAKRRSACDV